MFAMRIRLALAIVLTLAVTLTSLLSLGETKALADACPDGESRSSVSSDEADELGRWDAFLPGMFK